jgi:hypothetical protein
MLTRLQARLFAGRARKAAQAQEVEARSLRSQIPVQRTVESENQRALRAVSEPREDSQP